MEPGHGSKARLTLVLVLLALSAWCPALLAQPPDAAPGERSRRGGGWNWVGVVSGLFNPNDSGVGALERRPRHDEGYHEGGGCGRRSFAFG